MQYLNVKIKPIKILLLSTNTQQIKNIINLLIIITN